MFEKNGISYTSEEEYESEKKNPIKKKSGSCFTVIFSFLIVSLNWLDIRFTLWIEEIDDYHDFMDNNVNGKITKQDENNEDYAAFYIYEYTKKGYDTDRYYDYKRYVYFYEENDGTYSAVISN